MTVIGTSQFYDRARSSLSALDERAQTLQEQISTGKRLTTASQDPTGWRQLQTLARASADDAAWAGNVKFAQATLDQTGGVVSNIVTRVQRAQELAVQANSGTLDAAKRSAIAIELDSIVTDLNVLAQSRDSNGAALFAADPTAVPIGAGQSVQVNETPDRTFGTGAANVMTVISTLATALRGTSNDMTAAAGAALGGLQTAQDAMSGVLASVGSRATRIELVAGRIDAAELDRAGARSAIEDTDLTATITELQKTMTILQATQASFSKLSQLSLFAYLR